MYNAAQRVLMYGLELYMVGFLVGAVAYMTLGFSKNEMTGLDATVPMDS